MWASQLPPELRVVKSNTSSGSKNDFFPSQYSGVQASTSEPLSAGVLERQAPFSDPSLGYRLSGFIDQAVTLSPQDKVACRRFLSEGCWAGMTASDVKAIQTFLNAVLQPAQQTALGLSLQDLREVTRVRDLMGLRHETKSEMSAYMRDALLESQGISAQEQKFRSSLHLIDPQADGIRVLADELLRNGQITKGSSLTEIAEKSLSLVQNRFRYIKEPNDPDGSEQDRWQSIDETMRLGGGDCEDLAMLQASLLMNLMEQMGYSQKEIRQRVFISAGYMSDAAGNQKGHVLVRLQMDSGDLALDATGKTGPVQFESLPFDVVFEANDRRFNVLQEIDPAFVTALDVTGSTEDSIIKRINEVMQLLEEQLQTRIDIPLPKTSYSSGADDFFGFGTQDIMQREDENTGQMVDITSTTEFSFFTLHYSTYEPPLQNNRLYAAEIKEEAFLNYVNATRNLTNELLLLYHIGNSYLDFIANEATEIGDSGFDEQTKGAMQDVRDSGDKYKGKMVSAMNNYLQKSNNYIQQVSQQIFQFVDSNNATQLQMAQYKIDNFARESLFTALPSALIDEFTNAFQLSRVAKKTEITETMAKIAAKNMTAYINYTREMTTSVRLWAEGRTQSEISAEDTPNGGAGPLGYGATVWNIMEGTGGQKDAYLAYLDKIQDQVDTIRRNMSSVPVYVAQYGLSTANMNQEALQGDLFGAHGDASQFVQANMDQMGKLLEHNAKFQNMVGIALLIQQTLEDSKRDLAGRIGGKKGTSSSGQVRNVALSAVSAELSKQASSLQSMQSAAGALASQATDLMVQRINYAKEITRTVAKVVKFAGEIAATVLGEVLGATVGTTIAGVYGSLSALPLATSIAATAAAAAGPAAPAVFAAVFASTYATLSATATGIYQPLWHDYFSRNTSNTASAVLELVYTAGMLGLEYGTPEAGTARFIQEGSYFGRGENAPSAAGGALAKSEQSNTDIWTDGEREYYVNRSAAKVLSARDAYNMQVDEPVRVNTSGAVASGERNTQRTEFIADRGDGQLVVNGFLMGSREADVAMLQGDVYALLGIFKAQRDAMENIVSQMFGVQKAGMTSAMGQQIGNSIGMEQQLISLYKQDSNLRMQSMNMMLEEDKRRTDLIKEMSLGAARLGFAILHWSNIPVFILMPGAPAAIPIYQGIAAGINLAGQTVNAADLLYKYELGPYSGNAANYHKRTLNNEESLYRQELQSAVSTPVPEAEGLDTKGKYDRLEQLENQQLAKLTDYGGGIGNWGNNLHDDAILEYSNEFVEGAGDLPFRQVNYDTASRVYQDLTEITALRVFYALIEQSLYQQKQNTLRAMFGVSSGAGPVDTMMSLLDMYNSAILNGTFDSLLQEAGSRATSSNVWENNQISKIIESSVLGLTTLLSVPIVYRFAKLAFGGTGKDGTDANLRRLARAQAAVRVAGATAKLTFGFMLMYTVKGSNVSIESQMATYDEDENGNPTEKSVGDDEQEISRSAGGQKRVSMADKNRAQTLARRRERQITLMREISLAMADATADAAEDAGGVSSSKSYKGILKIIGTLASADVKQADFTYQALKQQADAYNKGIQMVSEAATTLLSEAGQEMSRRSSAKADMLKGQADAIDQKNGARSTVDSPAGNLARQSEARHRLFVKLEGMFNSVVTQALIESFLWMLASAEDRQVYSPFASEDSGAREKVEGEAKADSGDSEGFADLDNLENALLGLSLTQANVSMLRDIQSDRIQLASKMMASPIAAVKGAIKNSIAGVYKDKATKERERQEEEALDALADMEFDEFKQAYDFHTGMPSHVGPTQEEIYDRVASDLHEEFIEKYGEDYETDPDLVAERERAFAASKLPEGEQAINDYMAKSVYDPNNNWATDNPNMPDAEREARIRYHKAAIALGREYDQQSHSEALTSVGQEPSAFDMLSQMRKGTLYDTSDKKIGLLTQKFGSALTAEQAFEKLQERRAQKEAQLRQKEVGSKTLSEAQAGMAAKDGISLVRRQQQLLSVLDQELAPGYVYAFGDIDSDMLGDGDPGQSDPQKRHAQKQKALQDYLSDGQLASVFYTLPQEDREKVLLDMGVDPPKAELMSMYLQNGGELNTAFDALDLDKKEAVLKQLGIPSQWAEQSIYVDRSGKLSDRFYRLSDQDQANVLNTLAGNPVSVLSGSLSVSDKAALMFAAGLGMTVSQLENRLQLRQEIAELKEEMAVFAEEGLVDPTLAKPGSKYVGTDRRLNAKFYNLSPEEQVKIVMDMKVADTTEEAEAFIALGTQGYHEKKIEQFQNKIQTLADRQAAYLDAREASLGVQRRELSATLDRVSGVVQQNLQRDVATLDDPKSLVRKHVVQQPDGTYTHTNTNTDNHPYAISVVITNLDMAIVPDESVGPFLIHMAPEVLDRIDLDSQEDLKALVGATHGELILDPATAAALKDVQLLRREIAKIEKEQRDLQGAEGAGSGLEVRALEVLLGRDDYVQNQHTYAGQVALNRDGVAAAWNRMQVTNLGLELNHRLQGVTVADLSLGGPELHLRESRVSDIVAGISGEVLLRHLAAKNLVDAHGVPTMYARGLSPEVLEEQIDTINSDEHVMLSASQTDSLIELLSGRRQNAHTEDTRNLLQNAGLITADGRPAGHLADKDSTELQALVDEALGLEGISPHELTEQGASDRLAVMAFLGPHSRTQDVIEKLKRANLVDAYGNVSQDEISDLSEMDLRRRINGVLDNGFSASEKDQVYALLSGKTNADHIARIQQTLSSFTSDSRVDERKALRAQIAALDKQDPDLSKLSNPELALLTGQGIILPNGKLNTTRVAELRANPELADRVFETAFPGDGGRIKSLVLGTAREEKRKKLNTELMALETEALRVMGLNPELTPANRLKLQIMDEARDPKSYRGILQAQSEAFYKQALTVEEAERKIGPVESRNVFMQAFRGVADVLTLAGIADVINTTQLRTKYKEERKDLQRAKDAEARGIDRIGSARRFERMVDQLDGVNTEAKLANELVANYTKAVTGAKKASDAIDPERNTLEKRLERMGTFYDLKDKNSPKVEKEVLNALLEEQRAAIAIRALMRASNPGDAYYSDDRLDRAADLLRRIAGGGSEGADLASGILRRMAAQGDDVSLLLDHAVTHARPDQLRGLGDAVSLAMASDTRFEALGIVDHSPTVVGTLLGEKPRRAAGKRVMGSKEDRLLGHLYGLSGMHTEESHGVTKRLKQQGTASYKTDAAGRIFTDAVLQSSGFSQALGYASKGALQRAVSAMPQDRVNAFLATVEAAAMDTADIQADVSEIADEIGAQRPNRVMAPVGVIAADMLAENMQRRDTQFQAFEIAFRQALGAPDTEEKSDLIQEAVSAIQRGDLKRATASLHAAGKVGSHFALSRDERQDLARDMARLVHDVSEIMQGDIEIDVNRASLEQHADVMSQSESFITRSQVLVMALSRREELRLRHARQALVNVSAVATLTDEQAAFIGHRDRLRESATPLMASDKDAFDDEALEDNTKRRTEQRDAFIAAFEALQRLPDTVVKTTLIETATRHAEGGDLDAAVAALGAIPFAGDFSALSRDQQSQLRDDSAALLLTVSSVLQEAVHTDAKSSLTVYHGALAQESKDHVTALENVLSQVYGTGDLSLVNAVDRIQKAADAFSRIRLYGTEQAVNGIKDQIRTDVSTGLEASFAEFAVPSTYFKKLDEAIRNPVAMDVGGTDNTVASLVEIQQKLLLDPVGAGAELENVKDRVGRLISEAIDQGHPEDVLRVLAILRQSGLTDLIKDLGAFVGIAGDGDQAIVELEKVTDVLLVSPGGQHFSNREPLIKAIDDFKLGILDTETRLLDQTVHAQLDTAKKVGALRQIASQMEAGDVRVIQEVLTDKTLRQDLALLVAQGAALNDTAAYRILFAIAQKSADEARVFAEDVGMRLSRVNLEIKTDSRKVDLRDMRDRLQEMARTREERRKTAAMSKQIENGYGIQLYVTAPLLGMTRQERIQTVSDMASRNTQKAQETVRVLALQHPQSAASLISDALGRPNPTLATLLYQGITKEIPGANGRTLDQIHKVLQALSDDASLGAVSEGVKMQGDIGKDLAQISARRFEIRQPTTGSLVDSFLSTVLTTDDTGGMSLVPGKEAQLTAQIQQQVPRLKTALADVADPAVTTALDKMGVTPNQMTVEEVITLMEATTLLASGEARAVRLQIGMAAMLSQTTPRLLERQLLADRIVVSGGEGLSDTVFVDLLNNSQYIQGIRDVLEVLAGSRPAFFQTNEGFDAALLNLSEGGMSPVDSAALLALGTPLTTAMGSVNVPDKWLALDKEQANRGATFVPTHYCHGFEAWAHAAISQSALSPLEKQQARENVSTAMQDILSGKLPFAETVRGFFEPERLFFNIPDADAETLLNGVTDFPDTLFDLRGMIQNPDAREQVLAFSNDAASMRVLKQQSPDLYLNVLSVRHASSEMSPDIDGDMAVFNRFLSSVSAYLGEGVTTAQAQAMGPLVSAFLNGDPEAAQALTLIGAADKGYNKLATLFDHIPNLDARAMAAKLHTLSGALAISGNMDSLDSLATSVHQLRESVAQGTYGVFRDLAQKALRHHHQGVSYEPEMQGMKAHIRMNQDAFETLLQGPPHNLSPEDAATAIEKRLSAGMSGLLMLVGAQEQALGTQGPTAVADARNMKIARLALAEMQILDLISDDSAPIATMDRALAGFLTQSLDQNSAQMMPRLRQRLQTPGAVNRLLAIMAQSNLPLVGPDGLGDMRADIVKATGIFEMTSETSATAMVQFLQEHPDLASQTLALYSNPKDIAIVINRLVAHQEGDSSWAAGLLSRMPEPQIPDRQGYWDGLFSQLTFLNNADDKVPVFAALHATLQYNPILMDHFAVYAASVGVRPEHMVLAQTPPGLPIAVDSSADRADLQCMLTATLGVLPHQIDMDDAKTLVMDVLRQDYATTALTDMVANPQSRANLGRLVAEDPDVRETVFQTLSTGNLPAATLKIVTGMHGISAMVRAYPMDHAVDGMLMAKVLTDPSMIQQLGAQALGELTTLLLTQGDSAGALSGVMSNPHAMTMIQAGLEGRPGAVLSQGQALRMVGQVRSGKDLGLLLTSVPLDQLVSVLGNPHFLSGRTDRTSIVNTGLAALCQAGHANDVLLDMLSMPTYARDDGGQLAMDGVSKPLKQLIARQLHAVSALPDRSDYQALLGESVVPMASPEALSGADYSPFIGTLTSDNPDLLLLEDALRLAKEDNRYLEGLAQSLDQAITNMGPNSRLIPFLTEDPIGMRMVMRLVLSVHEELGSPAMTHLHTHLQDLNFDRLETGLSSANTAEDFVKMATSRVLLSSEQKKVLADSFTRKYPPEELDPNTPDKPTPNRDAFHALFRS